MTKDSMWSKTIVGEIERIDCLYYLVLLPR